MELAPGQKLTTFYLVSLWRTDGILEVQGYEEPLGTLHFWYKEDSPAIVQAQRECSPNFFSLESAARAAVDGLREVEVQRLLNEIVKLRIMSVQVTRLKSPSLFRLM